MICIRAIIFCTCYRCGAGTAFDICIIVLSGNAADDAIAFEGDVAEDVAVLDRAL